MIPFNKPFLSGNEIDNIIEAHKRGKLAGDGHFTQECNKKIANITGAKNALLTHSCTAALEMAAILLNINPGDEVIMPSYTFVSTANAFVLRGATIVFVDVDPFSFNIDPARVQEAITVKTRAVVAVHYAGCSCDMDELRRICVANSLALVEDAAQAIGGAYKGQPLGSFGCLGALSFHETKNIISGEGGALLINDSALQERAEIIREKGTNRSKFFRGQVDKYTWVDIGSSYLPGEIIAAFLHSQLKQLDEINKLRLAIWKAYYESLINLEVQGKLKIQKIPSHNTNNAHMFYVLLTSAKERALVMDWLKKRGVMSVFHYVPLHSSPAGMIHGKTLGPLPNTELASDCLLRLPMGPNLNVREVTATLQSYFSS